MELDQAMNALMDETLELEDFGVSSPHRNKDGIASHITTGIATIPLEYAENPWLRDDERGPRCEGVAVGFRDRYWPPRTVVLAPVGKDVHHVEMDEDQLRRLAAVLLAYADCLANLAAG